MLGARGVLLIGVSMLFSCSKKALLPNDYYNYVRNPENGLIKEKKIDNYTFKLQYKPLKFIALQELGPAGVSSEAVQNIVSDIKGSQYFTFSIATDREDVLKYTSNEDMSLYNVLINYLSFDIKNDLNLIDGKDTLNCTASHYVRDYGLSPKIDLAIAFPETTNDEDKMFVYKDQVFGVGNVIIKINKKNIIDIPNLKISGNE